MDEKKIILLLIMAFLPPIIYAIWIRNTEKYNRERWFTITICFMWGATIAIVASLFLEVFLGSIAISIFEAENIHIILAVIIAPFAEELTKPMVFRYKTVKKELDELEDGLILGAVAGLGFSATENLFYGYDAFINQGLIYFLILIIIRSFGGCLLHASATAWTGYGFAKKIMGQSTIIRVIPYFLLAFFIHALYNAVLSFEEIGPLIGLLMALSLAGITITIVRKKIKKLDNQTNMDTDYIE